MKNLIVSLLASTCFVISPWFARAGTPTDTPGTNSVSFEEIQNLIRKHLAGVTDAELNDAAVKGLLNEFRPHVVLGHAPTATANSHDTNSPVTKADRFRKDFGYLRVESVRSGLRAALQAGIDDLLKDGALHGLVIDLRFCGGADYAEAANAASLFGKTDGPILRVGDKTYSGASNSAAVLIPVMALTNGSTSGAGEALAAALRFIKAGLVIGEKTAGEAMQFEEFTLSNGQVISIASKPVELGDGTAIPRKGLTPDIGIDSSIADDRHYMDNPYWASESSEEIKEPALQHRITEADLVRQRREGLPLQDIISSEPDRPANMPKLVKDPALGRALDMLKALSVVQTWKRDPKNE